MVIEWLLPLVSANGVPFTEKEKTGLRQERPHIPLRIAISARDCQCSFELRRARAHAHGGLIAARHRLCSQ